MSRLGFTLVAGATLLASACGGAAYQANYKPVTIKAEVREVKPAPKVEPPPMETGSKIEISDNIHFHTQSARIRRRSYRVLDEVVEAMRLHPEVVVEIQGHTDSQGSDRKNRRLSARRALHVQEYLIRRGIDPRRLSAVGHGEQRPVATNDTREGRYANRRVDFIVIGKISDLPTQTSVASSPDSRRIEDSDDFDVRDNDRRSTTSRRDRDRDRSRVRDRNRDRDREDDKDEF
jgi:outer membrane protein OmpA-like peptidoglycan-associated protein